MKLSILIPVFNEERTIEKLLKKVISAPIRGWRKEIVVVDDCSTDKTHKILAALTQKYKFKLIKHGMNTGKGGAVKTALKYATGDIVLTQDADLEYDPKDYKILLSAYGFKNPVVYGSRNLGATNRGYLICYLCGRCLTLLNNLLYGSSITDINTGYKLFRADIIKNANLQVDGFDFCHEITAKVLRSGYKIKEVPINYYPRSYSEGKKVKVRDAILDLWTTIKYRFVK
ncbi:MAG: glycosyltransferase family 2 protein [Candidatus Blackburnbacteria bacterium]|nr:glycosyltransferase family 2 protein [Candidatus Blackburnbacteria bacterium]